MKYYRNVVKWIKEATRVGQEFTSKELGAILVEHVFEREFSKSKKFSTVMPEKYTLTHVLKMHPDFDSTLQTNGGTYLWRRLV